MHDLKYLRANLAAVADALRIKGFELDQDSFSALDARRKESDVETQNLQAQRKKASKQVGELIGKGMSVDDAKAEVAVTLERIDSELARHKELGQAIEQELSALLLGLPNTPDPSVPPGNDENDNVEVSRHGEPPAFDFEVRDHVDLGAILNGIDSETAANITGARFTVLKGQVAALHRALGQFMLNTHVQQHGYCEVNVPLVVNDQSLLGTGQLPKFEEDLFKLQVDANYYLIPTAEVPVTNLVREQIVDAIQLPLKYVAHTACFRSEAGSHGRDTRGLIRQHQFEKVELVQMVEPSQSGQALEALTGEAEAILQALGLAYRKVVLCGGDLSFSSRKTYDLEVWLPSQQCYREISSCSNFGDFQARRMQARWRNPETGKPEPLHTLNGSGLAIGRTLVAVLENFQEEDGSVEVPQVLQPYLGGLERLTPA